MQIFFIKYNTKELGLATDYKRASKGTTMDRETLACIGDTMIIVGIIMVIYFIFTVYRGCIMVAEAMRLEGEDPEASHPPKRQGGGCWSSREAMAPTVPMTYIAEEQQLVRPEDEKKFANGHQYFQVYDDDALVGWKPPISGGDPRREGMVKDAVRNPYLAYVPMGGFHDTS